MFKDPLYFDIDFPSLWGLYYANCLVL